MGNEFMVSSTPHADIQTSGLSTRDRQEGGVVRRNPGGLWKDRISWHEPASQSQAL